MKLGLYLESGILHCNQNNTIISPMCFEGNPSNQRQNSTSRSCSATMNLTKKDENYLPFNNLNSLEYLQNKYIVMFETKPIKFKELSNLIWGFEINNPLNVYHIEQFEDLQANQSTKFHVSTNSWMTSSNNDVNSYHNLVYNKLLKSSFKSLIENLVERSGISTQETVLES